MKRTSEVWLCCAKNCGLVLKTQFSSKEICRYIFRIEQHQCVMASFQHSPDWLRGKPMYVYSPFQMDGLS